MEQVWATSLKSMRLSFIVFKNKSTHRGLNDDVAYFDNKKYQTININNYTNKRINKFLGLN